MDVDARLRALESRYRKLARAALIAKAHYLALLDEGGAGPAAVQRARQSWQQWNEQERAVADRMGDNRACELERTI
jgi:transposase